MTTLQTRIVGAMHHEGAQTKLNVLRPGTPVELRREPDNPHDANAIQCWKEGVMLGFIRAKDNPQAAAAMDRGDPVSCQIFPAQPMVRLTWPSVVPFPELQATRHAVRR